ncbi:MAG: DUF4982 domain-containing protein [Clostridia bacterium]|nr:DUF4982 domain-containing protein [Clostridia bacterium]
MKIDFNNDWIFYKENGEKTPVTLPHDAMLAETRRPDAAAGTNNGYFPGGVYTYEKRFTVAEADADKSFVLHFEGVYGNTSVFINGKIAARHRYGYTAFDADLTGLVQAGENEIAVVADNALQPNCRWYTGSGIYRPVMLFVRDKNHIQKLRISTLSAVPAVIRVETDADEIEIFDGDACVYAGRPGDVTLPDAKLWSAETPYLYTCVARTQTDEASARFGVRHLAWSAEKGLTVNGETVKLRGGCLHHDHGILGAAQYREAEFRRVRILKEQGFNAIRAAHNPASQLLLDACDEVGMYVMDEAFDGWYIPKTYHDYSRVFREDWKDDVASMVNGAFNHPCVILYSVGNEITETAEEKGVRLCAEMRDFVRSIDDTRPVTAGINVLLDVYAKMGLGVYRDKGAYKPEPQPETKTYKDKRSGSAFFNYWTQKLGGLFFLMSKGKTARKVVNEIAPTLDIVGLNYASSRYDEDAAAHPDRLMVGTETMAADLPYNWARVLRYPQLIGDFVWAAWDYLGETCMGWTYRSYPGLPLLSGQGMIDITGLPLAQMAFLRTVWGLDKKPYVGVRPLNHADETPVTGAWQFTNALSSWTWHGYEGKKCVVEVYSAAPSVRLTLNGREIGTEKTKDCRALFRLNYEPGTLTAEVLNANGSVVSSNSLCTGGKETVITAKPEKTRVAPGEIVFVPVSFTDQNGETQPYREDKIELTVENAALLGFGSALYKTDERFDSSVHTAYRGRTLAVLRAGEQGNIIITAKGGGCPASTAEIEVTP